MATRILVVDDHDVVRASVRMILAMRGDWEVCGEATNGRRAVEMAEKLDPDLIVMDVTMPVTSGLDAAKDIAKLALRAKVLMLSTHELHPCDEEMATLGIHGYVQKSRAVRDLVHALDVLLQGGKFVHAAEEAEVRN